MLNTEGLARKIAEENSTEENRVYISAARAWIKMIFDAIKEEMVEGGSVRINDFGTFYLAERKIMNAHVMDGDKVVGDVPPFIRYKMKIKTCDAVDAELQKLDRLI